MVFRCPCGTDPINRSPREQRPLSRTMLVLVAVSSINTNRAGLSIPCSLIQRRRARATSGRSCSAARRLFFDSYIMSLEKSPDGGAAARDSALVHRGDHLIQGQIRLLGYQSQQPIRALLQRRRTPSARLCPGASSLAPALKPPHRRTGAEPVVFGSLTPRRPGFHGFDNTLSQVVRIRLRHRFGPPKHRINASRLAYRKTLGNPLDSTTPECALNSRRSRPGTRCDSIGPSGANGDEATPVSRATLQGQLNPVQPP